VPAVRRDARGGDGRAQVFQGKLQTFYGQGAAIVHANPLFNANRVPHWTTGASPTRIHYADQYNAILYVVAEYAMDRCIGTTTSMAARRRARRG
jgi:hypothetical protein